MTLNSKSIFYPVTLPKSLGGVGLRKLPKLYIALAGKQIWHVISKPQSLLSKVFVGKYGDGQGENLFQNRKRNEIQQREIIQFMPIQYVGSFFFKSLLDGKS